MDVNPYLHSVSVWTPDVDVQLGPPFCICQEILINENKSSPQPLQSQGAPCLHSPPLHASFFTSSPDLILRHVSTF